MMKARSYLDTPTLSLAPPPAPPHRQEAPTRGATATFAISEGMEKLQTSSERVAPRLMSLPQAARALGVSDRFLRMLEQRGQLRLTRLGRRVLVPIDEVERLAVEGAQ